MMLLRGTWTRRPLLLPTPGPRGRAPPRPRTPLPQVLQVKCGNLKYYQSHLYSTVVPPDEITVNYRHGLPLITLTLPSRKERCQFVVKPMSSTVGSFLQDLQSEDKGVKTAAIFTADGSEIPASTLMEILLMNDFKLVINKITYDVQCPRKERQPAREGTQAGGVGEEEAGSQQKSPMWGSIPGFWDHALILGSRPEPKADTQRLSHPGAPCGAISERP